MNKFFGPHLYDWYFNFNWYSVANTVHNLKELFWYYPKEVIKRGTKGYSHRDLWSFDAYLLQVLHNGMKELKRIKHGYPCDCQKPWDNNRDCQCERKFDEALDKMVEGMEAGRRIIDLDYRETYDSSWEEKIKEDKKIFDEAMDLFKEYFFALWD